MAKDLKTSFLCSTGSKTISDSGEMRRTSSLWAMDDLYLDIASLSLVLDLVSGGDLLLDPSFTISFALAD